MGALVRALETRRQEAATGAPGLYPTEAEPVGGDNFMVGSSPAMLEVFERLRRFATVDAPVLITGESGTGKELAARAIHERSARAAGPFIAINCAALPLSLVNSELFGHEKGAFTGAVDRRIGHIELAQGGTLFLDEIGDLPAEIQGHLLRFLQDRTITRLGGRKPIPVDTRIVSATHVPLHSAMQAHHFREDLFYRLAVLTVEMPPLRARSGDIDLLARVFLDRVARDFGRNVEGYEPAALQAMRDYAWPGNVRQLIAVIRRAVVMSQGRIVRREDLVLDPMPEDAIAERPAMPPRRGRPRPGSPEEREGLIEALSQSGHCVAQCARRLKVSRVTLYRMLERNGLAARR
ncbi:sigma-54 interaction domain-containing protein [Neoroseomonas eburnea]|nr:sigma-54 dependent transcriptional regulator [Neoroseomonas eburnea]